jgi:hypothetical protein
MAVLGLGCFRAASAGTGEMLTSHATLGAAVEDAFPGLTGMQLAKAGDRRGTGVTLGLTRRRAAGVAGAPGIPQAGAAFSPAQGIATRYAAVAKRCRPRYTSGSGPRPDVLPGRRRESWRCKPDTTSPKWRT